MCTAYVQITHKSQAIDNAATPTQSQRRRQAATPDADVDMTMEESQQTGSGSLEQLSKGLVRYALSCEFARKPIKRQDVNEKGQCTAIWLEWV
jgi:hypothetical protein